MTGYFNLNHPLFHAEAARLRGLGYTVVNPAEINGDPDALWELCMRQDIAELIKCEGVACLPGWTNSKGARLEVHIGTTLGMRVMMASDLKDKLFTPPAITLRCHDANACAAGQRACPSPRACGVDA